MGLQRENGSKNINSKAITGLTIHKTLKASLPPKLDDITSDQLHFTEDGGIYLSKKDGTFQQMGGSAVNSDDYLTKDEYKGSTDGVVKKADVSIEVDGVKSASPLMYYGTDNKGNVGFHYIPSGSGGTGGSGIEQKVILSATTNSKTEIESEYKLDEAKCLIQAYKFTAGGNNIIKTIKEFNNDNASSFYYDKESTDFENGMTIKTEFDVAVNAELTLYKTETINKNLFSKMKLVERG